MPRKSGVVPKHIRYSELFRSFNGEGGPEMGAPTIWLRLWGCNFRCAGFTKVPGAEAPQPPADAQSVEVLPVIESGCDSRYSWAKEFHHLSRTASAQELADKIESMLQRKDNPAGLFAPSGCGAPYRLGLTGGEPLLNQTAITALLHAFISKDNSPRHICIETNGTQALRTNFHDVVGRIHGRRLFWSVSPKLSLSGESRSEAIKPDIVASYHAFGDDGQLKFVVDGSDACWGEIESALAEYRGAGVDWPAYAMPVGATQEQQEALNEKVAVGALDRGFGFSGRLHCWVFGNRVGT